MSLPFRQFNSSHISLLPFLPIYRLFLPVPSGTSFPRDLYLKGLLATKTIWLGNKLTRLARCQLTGGKNGKLNEIGPLSWESQSSNPDPISIMGKSVWSQRAAVTDKGGNADFRTKRARFTFLNVVLGAFLYAGESFLGSANSRGGVDSEGGSASARQDTQHRIAGLERLFLEFTTRCWRGRYTFTWTSIINLGSVRSSLRVNLENRFWLERQGKIII